MECNLCGNKAWAGADCQECPGYQKLHYVEGVGAKEKTADYFCIAESPLTSGLSGIPPQHIPWDYDVEASIRRLFKKTTDFNRDFRSFTGRFSYAVRCEIDKPVKAHIASCRTQLHDELQFYAQPDKPIMIFALGPAVLKAFNLKKAAYKKVQGRFIDAHIGDRPVVLFPSISKRQLLRSTGHFEILADHIQTFLTAVYNVQHGRVLQEVTPIEDLTAHYVYPKTLKELRELTEIIINYAGEGEIVNNCPLAIDTETNTLYPHREKLKLLTFTVAWAPGYAASIPVEHTDSPFTLEQVAPYIQTILSCKKAKLLHNAKFDLRVLWKKGWDINHLAWDTMVSEHLLSEDKRGYYGLKYLVREFLPTYRDYEDGLHKTIDAIPVPEPEPEEGAIEVHKKLKNDDGFARVPLCTLHPYGAMDTDVTLQLAKVQLARMEIEQDAINSNRQECQKYPHYRRLTRALTSASHPIKNLAQQHMIPVIRTLAKMESRGMRVDHDYLNTLHSDMTYAIANFNVKIMEMIPPHLFDDFNPSSTQQLSKLLFSTGFNHPETGENINYNNRVEPPLTPTGQISTNAKFLRSLVTQYQCPFTEVILEYRALQKARNTFIENIRGLSLEDGRMHTSFHPHGTVTGRLSSSGENMQNIPKKIGKHNIKKCFIPTDPGTQVIIQADAKAAEVRIYAAYSQDPNLIKALNDGMDPHSFFSSMILNPDTIVKDVSPANKKMMLSVIGIDDEHAWNYDDFENRDTYVGTKKNPGSNPAYGKRLSRLRTNIKRVVFGILYGAYKTKIASIVGIAEDQAQLIIDALFKMFPTIPKYIEMTKDQVVYSKMVETFFGRRRRFPNWKAMTPRMKNKAERQAINFKIQSTSSEIVLQVLSEMDSPVEEDFQGHQLITVHDSIVSELPKKYLNQYSDLLQEYGVKRIAQQCKWLPVPFKWDIEVGPSYGELIPLGTYLEEQAIEPKSILTQEQDATSYIATEIRQELAESCYAKEQVG